MWYGFSALRVNGGNSATRQRRPAAQKVPAAATTSPDRVDKSAWRSDDDVHGVSGVMGQLEVLSKPKTVCDPGRKSTRNAHRRRRHCRSKSGSRISRFSGQLPAVSAARGIASSVSAHVRVLF